MDAVFSYFDFFLDLLNPNILIVKPLSLIKDCSLLGLFKLSHIFILSQPNVLNLINGLVNETT